MKYMMLVCLDTARFEAQAVEEDAAARQATDAQPTEGEDSFPWLDEVMAAGVRLDGDRLRPPSEATTIRVRDGEVLLGDGPFAETKEAICGYDILECASMAEAVAIAAKHPVAAVGSIEVRAFW
jgi:hypothetical protein